MEKWLLSDRVNYWSSPAIREMTKGALELAGLGIIKWPVYTGFVRSFHEVGMGRLYSFSFSVFTQKAAR